MQSHNILLYSNIFQNSILLSLFNLTYIKAEAQDNNKRNTIMV
jgi:hypothetical protein